MSRTCRTCPDRVPIVSPDLAARIVARIPDKMSRQSALDRSVVWLTTQHPGLSVYEGIIGRVYNPVEKVAIALETSAAANTPCPFVDRFGGCVLGGCATPEEWKRDDDRCNQYLFLPTAIARALDRPGLTFLAQSHAVADAKLAGLTRNKDFPDIGTRGSDGYLSVANRSAAPKKTEEVAHERIPPHLSSRADGADLRHRPERRAP